MFKKWYGSLALLLILSVFLAACGGAAPAAPASEGDAAAAPAAPAADTAASGAAAPEGIAEVPRNRTLIIAGLGGEHPGAFTDVELFNSYVVGFSRSGFTQACTEALFYYNMLGDEFTPWLAEGFEYNEDFTEVTVTIRNGVTWSDGTPFTADDIDFTLNMLLENPAVNYAGEIVDTVASTEVIDERTIRIILTGPNPRFIFDKLTFHADLGVPLVPKHTWEGQDPSTFNNYDPERGLPLCTGPYELVYTDVQRKIWDLREDWWGAETGFQPLPQIERLVFLPGMDENTMVQLISNNEIDLAFSFTPQNMELAQNQNQAITTFSDEQPFGFLDWWPIGLGFNTTVAPFDDPEIRWAISYSLNRDEIIEFAFRNTSKAVKLPYPDYPGLRPFMEGISDLLEEYPTNEYNPDKAAEIMESKGYTRDAEGFWVLDGQRISFEIITFPQHPSTTPQVPVVTEQLRRAGFDASFLLPADFVTRIQTGAAHAFLWGHGGSMRDPYATLERLYHIKHVKPTGEQATANFYRWSNQELSDIIDQMTSVAEDDPQLHELFRQAMEIWLPELPDIPLVETVILVPRNTTYWTNWPTADNPYIHEGFWHRTAMLLWINLEPTQ